MRGDSFTRQKSDFGLNLGCSKSFKSFKNNLIEKKYNNRCYDQYKNLTELNEIEFQNFLELKYAQMCNKEWNSCFRRI